MEDREDVEHRRRRHAVLRTGAGDVQLHSDARRAAARHEVFAYLANVTKQTEWVHGVTECHLAGDHAMGAGAVAEQSMKFMGKLRVVSTTHRRLRAEEEGLLRKDGALPHSLRVRARRRPGVDPRALSLEMEPRGFLRVLIPLIGKKTIEGDLVRIQERLERS
jgi:hypothetical protein